MKHKIAIYYDKSNDRCIFRANQLSFDPKTIIELKKYKLLDSTEEFELVIVDNSLNDRISHLRLKINENVNRFYSESDSLLHDNKIIEIIKILKTKDTTISFKYKDFNQYPSVTKELIQLNQYIFEDEVTKETIIGQPYARYDIYGIDNALCVSKKRPEIIIEVVDENFHNQDLFNFLIEKSKTTSTIVIYYFLKKEKKYNEVPNNENKYKEFRISCFIKEGIFYYCGIPLILDDHDISQKIENKYRYFNFVEKEIIKPIRKGQDINIKNLK